MLFTLFSGKTVYEIDSKDVSMYTPLTEGWGWGWGLRYGLG